MAPSCAGRQEYRSLRRKVAAKVQGWAYICLAMQDQDPPGPPLVPRPADTERRQPANQSEPHVIAVWAEAGIEAPTHASKPGQDIDPANVDAMGVARRELDHPESCPHEQVAVSVGGALQPRTHDHLTHDSSVTRTGFPNRP